MVERLPTGQTTWPATAMLVAWGVAELAFRLRLAMRAGWRERLGTWRVSAGGRLREWTFFLLVGTIATAVIGALRLAALSRLAVGGGAAVLAAGEAVVIAGVTLRIWAMVVLDQFFTFVVGMAADHRVIQAGPYRLLRHPGYAGALLALFGTGIALRNWLSLALIVVVPAIALAVRMTVEEATLRTALGAEYAAYASRTARLIPRVW